LQGFGFGLAFTPMSVLAFATLPRDKVTEGMSLFHLVRNFGSSLFISICVSEIVRSTGMNYARLVEFINPFNPGLYVPWVMGAWTAGDAAGLAKISQEITRQSAMIAYLNAFGLFTFVAALAIPFALLAKPARKPVPA
jgi:DHA2 family multidrug resistance protein